MAGYGFGIVVCAVGPGCGMTVKFSAESIRETRWYEFALRFLFGGLMTAVAGMIAKGYGPVLGGLFLAFPAIFPASATLVQKHEAEKKAQKGLRGEVRGKRAAAVEAAGAAMGSVGLLSFAAISWLLLPKHEATLVLLGATAVWLAVSVLVWVIYKV